MGVSGARYAGTKAAGMARSKEGAEEKLEARHLETAIRMASVLGEMKGAAMKVGQLASFVDTEFLPEEYREIYQQQMAMLRSSAEAMPWAKVEKVLEGSTRAIEWRPVRGLRARGVRGGVDRPGASGG